MTTQEQQAFDKAVTYIDKLSKLVDVVDDGLMKAHEFIGHVNDVVNDLSDTAQNVLLQASETLNEFTEGVWQRVEEDYQKVYNIPTASTKSDVQDSTEQNNEKSVGTDYDKVTNILTGLGFSDTPVTRSSFSRYSSEELDRIIKTLQAYDL